VQKIAGAAAGSCRFIWRVKLIIKNQKLKKEVNNNPEPKTI
jgi:hypothetical protein